MADDLLTLLACHPAQTDGSTVRELIAASGWNFTETTSKRMRERLRVLVTEGRVEVVKVRRPTLRPGQEQVVPAYRVKKEAS